MSSKKETVLVRPTYVGICGSDLQKIEAGVELSTLGHEIVGIANLHGKYTRVVVNPLIVCGECAYCISNRSMFCKSLRVIGRDEIGAFSGSLEVPVKNIIEIPNELSDTTAILADPYAVVWHGFGLQPTLLGATHTLIIGDGVVAVLNLMYLLFHGAFTAQYTVLCKTRDRANSLTAWLRETIKDASILNRVSFVGALNNDALFGLAIEAVGRDQTETFTAAVEHLEPRGYLLSYGVYPPLSMQSVGLRTVMYKEIIIQGVNSYTHESLTQAIDDLAKHHTIFEKIVGTVFSFSDRDVAIGVARDKMGPIAKKIIIKMEQS